MNREDAEKPDELEDDNDSDESFSWDMQTDLSVGPPPDVPEMILGTLRISFMVPGSQSLKDRRQAVNSMLGRLRSRFSVACSDLGPTDSWTRATIGVTACSNESGVLDKVLSSVEQFARRDHRLMVGSVERDVFSCFDE